eukprot:scaffold11693_cov115-Isochrysis_galbana.AAC.3
MTPPTERLPGPKMCICNTRTTPTKAYSSRLCTRRAGLLQAGQGAPGHMRRGEHAPYAQPACRARSTSGGCKGKGGSGPPGR